MTPCIKAHPVVKIATPFKAGFQPFSNSVLSESILISSEIKELQDIYEYEFINHYEIEEFLKKNGFLIKYLKNGVDKIKKIFGSDIQLCLEIDSGSDEKWDILYIVIKTEIIAKTTTLLEKKLSKDWFLDIIEETNRKLNFIVEPK